MSEGAIMITAIAIFIGWPAIKGFVRGWSSAPDASASRKAHTKPDADNRHTEAQPAAARAKRYATSTSSDDQLAKSIADAGYLDDQHDSPIAAHHRNVQDNERNS